jgi:hypothetical protein
METGLFVIKVRAAYVVRLSVDVVMAVSFGLLSCTFAIILAQAFAKPVPTPIERVPP